MQQEADEQVQISQTQLELALEKAYRRGFHQALALLATFYPKGISGGALTELANEQLRWRRELPPSSTVSDTATSSFFGEMSPLEQRLLHERE